MVPAEGYLFSMMLSAHGKESRRGRPLPVVPCSVLWSRLSKLIASLAILDVDDWVFNTIGIVIGCTLYGRFIKGGPRNKNM